MNIVIRYAPVPASTTEQYDEVMHRLQDGSRSTPATAAPARGLPPR